MSAVDPGVQGILESIGRGELASIYALHGEEGFQVDRARDAVVEALVQATGGEVEFRDGRDTPLGEVLESLLEMSLFSTRRIVAVRQAQHLAPGGKAELAALLGCSESWTTDGNILVLAAGQAFDKRTRFYKTLVSIGRVARFDALRGRDLARWVVEEASRRGLSFGAQAEDTLLARTGNSLRQIDLELEKLSLLIAPRKEILAEDVESVVPRSKEDVIFDLTGALGDREVSAGLRFLRELRFQGATPLMILSMLGREVRFLLQAKLLGGVVERAGWNERIGFDRFCRSIWPRLKSEVEPPSGNPRFHLLGANPYVAFLVLRRARQFSLAELRRGVGLIGRTDLALKSTTQSPDALLERLIIELALPGRETSAAKAS